MIARGKQLHVTLQINVQITACGGELMCEGKFKYLRRFSFILSLFILRVVNFVGQQQKERKRIWHCTPLVTWDTTVIITTYMKWEPNYATSA